LLRLAAMVSNHFGISCEAHSHCQGGDAREDKISHRHGALSSSLIVFDAQGAGHDSIVREARSKGSARSHHQTVNWITGAPWHASRGIH